MVKDVDELIEAYDVAQPATTRRAHANYDEDFGVEKPFCASCQEVLRI